jgi:hypothetical protein
LAAFRSRASCALEDLIGLVCGFSAELSTAHPLTANIVANLLLCINWSSRDSAHAQSCDFLRERTPIAPSRTGHHDFRVTSDSTPFEATSLHGLSLHTCRLIYRLIYRLNELTWSSLSDGPQGDAIRSFLRSTAAPDSVL